MAFDKNLAEKLTRVKSAVGGNREKQHFEFSFGMPEEEVFHITPPSRMNRRILAELEYALHVCEANDGAYAAELNAALDGLQESLKRDGVLTDGACAAAEETLMPMKDLCRSYKLFLTGHAHIDMNWMWSYQETVAATLATFRSICNIMDEYPGFTFTQSQGSVYRIVEQYDPELMERIKARIAEGRWEVAATNWVEPDKNMPSGESLLHHIELTRSYLRDVWGVKDFDLDFVPDTFGHALTIPEIDAFGGVKYMYHCRGNARKDLLYRYRAASGHEIMVLREANWYNAAITPQMAVGLMNVVKQSSGLKCGMVVYGVGDHGGGPTRRDVERAIDMMTWPIYPTIEFGGLRRYFKEAEAIRDTLPVVDEELNFFAPGCYTTQSRIKRGNRRAEAALYDVEALAALAEKNTDYRLARGQLEWAWRDVLFTHFHDILTGSCVQDSREHAMGLYQTTAAVTNTQHEKAMLALSKGINTASMPVLRDVKPWEKPSAQNYDSQSEGAGVGYGIENFVGVPAAERGTGLLRVFHVFNTLPVKRTGVVELTVWDYTGDLRRVHIQDAEGREIPFQMVDWDYQRYWDHRYVRVLAQVTVPATGYTTLVLRQREAENYPVYLQSGEQIARMYDDVVLQNEYVSAVIDRHSGRVKSLIDLGTGRDYIACGQTAGLEFLQTEKRSSNAWNIGRTIRDIPVEKCVELRAPRRQGDLLKTAEAVFSVEGGCRVPTQITVTYALKAGSRALEVKIKADWQEQGEDTIPVLTYKVPVCGATGKFNYIIPQGTIQRGALNNDVPGIGSSAACVEDGSALVLVSDSKYGYRGEADSLSVTLINSATSPDPYPERGVHNITLWLGLTDGEAGSQTAVTDDVNHALFYVPGNVHEGVLPTTDGLVELVAGNAAVTSVSACEGVITVRGFETAGLDGAAVLRFAAPVKGACLTDLSESGYQKPLDVSGCEVTVPMGHNAIWMVRVAL